MNSKPAVIITSIFDPNPVMREIADQCTQRQYDFIIAGDSVSPSDFFLEGATFLDMEMQGKSGAYGQICPERTYARKNLAYMKAIRSSAPWIVETDDDNMPRSEFWLPPSREVAGRKSTETGWVNAYRYFSDQFIYPRGYPIERALPDWQSSEVSVNPANSVCPIQQSLADANPDVDAIWRMLHPLPVDFQKNAPLILAENCWCPFNSQNTVFFPEAYPLLYLPATCSFRMTDIWRSFIAQRILWTCGWELSFHAATVDQERNEHNLLKDFEDEISGYLSNQKIIDLLESLPLKSGTDNMRINLEACYSAMVAADYFKPQEEVLLDAWLNDIEQ